jgi:flavin reductase (DIM6/NTAB) family NADH-FMN oxidoreductase RutF
MHFTEHDLQALGRITRLNLINSITGIKPANLIGTQSKEGSSNLAIFSSIVHLGSNPALLAFVLRPQGEVPRNTYENIKETGVYTINAVHTSFIKQAHYTSAKFDKDVCEFEKSGLTKEYLSDFKAPFVQESKLKMGMSYLEEVYIQANETTLIIGEVKHLITPDNAIQNGGHLDFGSEELAGISGLNSYYSLTKMAQFPYVREEYNLSDL